MGSLETNMGNAAAGQQQTAPTVERLEIWARPLISALAAQLGGKHSFVVIGMSDGSRYIVEKHHDGLIEWQELSRRGRVELELSKAKRQHEKLHVADQGRIKPGVTLEDLRQCAAAHDGCSDVHENNCHRLSQDLWNAAVVESKQLSSQEQKRLSWIASWIGVGASMRADAAAA